MLQLHLSYQQFYCLLRCDLYQMFYGIVPCQQGNHRNGWGTVFGPDKPVSQMQALLAACFELAVDYDTFPNLLYIFMPPPLGAGGIMFSGCRSVHPSVQSLKYPLLTCTWVRWSTRPTVTVLRHVPPSVCPSVHPERFPGICRRMHGENGLKFYMLMYLDHLQNWLVYGSGLLIFLILALFWLSERVKFGVSGHFLENAWRKWPEILHADVSWPPSELLSLWPWSVDFCNFGAILT